MKGVLASFVDISQVYPLPLPLPLPDTVCSRGGSKFNKAKLFGPSSKLGGRCPIITVKAGAEAGASTEIRVCMNRTCRRQGSLETLQILSGVAPPEVSVKSCGCLGRCGAGPNLVVLPQGTIVSHCGTATRVVHTMLNCCGGDPDSWSNSLAALALRKRAQDELGKLNNASEAELLLSQAINLKPFGGIHVLYTDRVWVYETLLFRSAVRLMIGNMVEALEDAKEASTLAPKYPEAYVCQGDALMAMDQFDAAEKSYTMALGLDPSICRSKSFKVMVRGKRVIIAVILWPNVCSDCKASRETHCCRFVLSSAVLLK